MTTPHAPSEPTCPLGVSERALSALRDGAMSGTEAARLAAHIETCPACGKRIAAFDDIATTLRSEHPPEPDERLWRAFTTAAGSPSRIRRQRFYGVGLAHPSWGRLSALVAVLLLAVGFVALFALQRPALPAQPTPTATALSATKTSTPTSTATPPSLLPAHPLAWQPLGSRIAAHSVVVVADDGASAYSCFVGSDAQGNSILHIWRTSDRGTHWISAREIPNDPTINGCELVVDGSDPSVAALAWQPRGGGGGDSYTGLMTTVDGGITWQAVPSEPFSRIDQLDSRGGVIYAIRETMSSSTNSVEYHLWASSDRMRSWRQVDQGLPVPVAGFWLQPGGSSILLVGSGGANAIASQLWRSPDGGATWHQLDVPGGLPSYTPARFASLGASASSIVASSLQGRFHICVSDATVGTSSPRSQLSVMCSTDGGGTWHARTLPTLTTPQGVSLGANLVAITSNDTLLAYGLGTLYRLGANADRWQSLGPLPEPAVAYCPSPGPGMLWAVPPAIGDPIDPQGRIFTATYTP